MRTLTKTVPILFFCLLAASGGFAYQEHHGHHQRWHTGINVSFGAEKALEKALSMAGINVDMHGRAKRPLKILGVNVHAGGEFEDTTVVVAARALLDGTFRSRLECYAAHAELTGTFEGDVVLKAARITLDSTTVIRGNFSFSAASIEGLDRATIEGSVSERPFETPEEKWSELSDDIAEAARVAVMATWILSFAGIALTGMALHALLPEHVNRVVETLDDSPWAAIGSGLVFFAAAPLLTALAIMTLVGITAGLVGGLLYLVALLTGQIYSALWLGRKLTGKLRGTASGSFYGPFLLGLAMIWLLGIIPFIGWLAGFLSLLLGLGALWLTTWRTIRSGRG